MIIECMLLAALAAAQVPPQAPPAPHASPAPAPEPDDPADLLPSGPRAHSTAQPELAPRAETAVYKPYGTHDISAVLGTKVDKDGKVHRVVAMPVVDGISADLAAHALHYPPVFHSSEERQRALSDVQRLAGVLATVTERDAGQADDASPELLLKLAMLWTIASNLDVPDAANQAVATFERLLVREPENRWVNYHYGVFLEGTATLQGKAEPYLQKALALGVDEAHVSLALLHASLGDTATALQDVDAWLKLHADDSEVLALAATLRSGKAGPAPAGH